MPEVNAKWKDEKIELLKEVDISVAVATENGLITPIVRDAPHLGLSSISDKVRVRINLLQDFNLMQLGLEKIQS